MPVIDLTARRGRLPDEELADLAALGVGAGPVRLREPAELLEAAPLSERWHELWFHQR